MFFNAENLQKFLTFITLQMKQFILNFKQTIRFIATIWTSREFAVIYVMLGTLSQVAHTYYLAESISSLDGSWRVAQAVILSLFISTSLLYFTAIADDADTKESRKVHFAVNMFTTIEILINIYYYTRHLLLENANPRYFDYILGLLIACAIPVTIKLYASSIRAKEWISDIEHDKQAFVSDMNEPTNETVVAEPEPINKDVIKEMVTEIMDENMQTVNISDEQLDEAVLRQMKRFEDETRERLTNENKETFIAWMDEKKESINEEIRASYKQNSDLFLTQFDNKLRMLTNKAITNQQ